MNEVIRTSLELTLGAFLFTLFFTYIQSHARIWLVVWIAAYVIYYIKLRRRRREG